VSISGICSPACGPPWPVSPSFNRTCCTRCSGSSGWGWRRCLCSVAGVRGTFELSGWKLAGTLVPLADIGWSVWLLALGISLLLTA
jgi:hypothetical protein